jgi:hypothetical protein
MFYCLLSLVASALAGVCLVDAIVTVIVGPLFEGVAFWRREARSPRELEGGFCTSFSRVAEVKGRSNEGDEKWSKAEKT